MTIIQNLSRYGLLLFGLAVVLNVALFIFAWMRG